MSNKDGGRRSSGTTDLNFKVDPGFHHLFKLTAALNGITMKELCEASFWVWLKQQPPEKIGDLMRIASNSTHV